MFSERKTEEKGGESEEERLTNKEEVRPDRVWTSCCFQLDRQFVTFCVQTSLGLCILSFCAWQLAVIDECERATPYWGLVGTITGFFFRKLTPMRKQ